MFFKVSEMNVCIVIRNSVKKFYIKPQIWAFDLQEITKLFGVSSHAQLTWTLMLGELLTETAHLGQAPQ